MVQHCWAAVLHSFYVISHIVLGGQAVAANLRTTFIILVSMVVFGDEITPLRVSGIILTLGGVVMYQKAKVWEAANAKAP